MTRAQDLIAMTEKYAAHNYAPLPVVLERAVGSLAYDVDGNRYIDMLAAYSALNFGHQNERILAAARKQLDTLTLTSRAFYTEEFALLAKELSAFCKKDQVLLMNSGAEAVETAIKAARKWGYDFKGVPEDRAQIICFEGNFHGRTTTVVGFSTSSESRAGFGPFGGGFTIVPFGDLEAVERAWTPHTVGVLVEPIQGEGGIIIPHEGFLRGLRKLCRDEGILLIADEVQTGLCRTGQIFACDHESVVPDIYILGKSLGGGIVPISAIVADEAVMTVFQPGTHGSTFGGNPFACAIAREVLRLIQDEEPHRNAAHLGEYFVQQLRALNSPVVREVRGRGLLVGVDIAPEFGTGKDYCKRLLKKGILSKDTRRQTIRFAPPLLIDQPLLDEALEKIQAAFA
jgi:ornithine--oxo-acid transaminase